MKKRVIAVIMAAMVVLAGCGNGGEGDSPAQTVEPVAVDTPEPTEEPGGELQGEGGMGDSQGGDSQGGESAGEPTQEPEEPREGMYRSELTNEWIDESLKDQRPIAVMVDNEKKALPHYGLTEADVVYEMMNSTLNGRITRFMAIVKDWGAIEQFGSVRSTRSTNIYLVGEWNAVLCHDGGPYYVMGNNTGYVGLIKEKDYCENFSGIFGRVKNGKPREYTEYILPGDLDKGFDSKKYSREYNEHYPGPHFTFSDTEIDLADGSGSFDCTKIELPFPHNSSTLEYNEATGTYDYYEYGSAHLDPQHDNAPLTFKNLLIQSCSFVQLDENGYMVYNVIDNSGNSGYYITNGKAIKVTWYKASDTSPTKFYDDSTGEEIKLNTGKTYIAIVPSDSWDDVVIK